MKKAATKGEPIIPQRYRKWTDEFASYRYAITTNSVEAWLDQFKDNRDLAARVLDSVDYYNSERIGSCLRDSLNSIPGWDRQSKNREGRWFFAPLSRSAGESGGSMMHTFRLANKLDRNIYNNLFPHLSELPAKDLCENDTIVLVDDLTASGKQVCDAWKGFLGELLATAGHIYLIVIVAGPLARDRIRNETDLSLIAAHSYDESDNALHEKCENFDELEKEILFKYSKRADRKSPRGYGDCGFLLVFQHRCPNNSLPILYAFHSRWQGLFPRNA